MTLHYTTPHFSKSSVIMKGGVVTTKLKDIGKNSLIQFIYCKINRIKTIWRRGYQVYPYLCTEHLIPERKAEVLNLYETLLNDELEGLQSQRQKVNKKVHYLRTEIKKLRGER